MVTMSFLIIQSKSQPPPSLKLDQVKTHTKRYILTLQKDLLVSNAVQRQLVHQIWTMKVMPWSAPAKLACCRSLALPMIFIMGSVQSSNVRLPVKTNP